MPAPLQPPPPPSAVSEEPGSWLARKGWWAIPCGCCGCLLPLIGIVAVVLFQFGSSMVDEVMEVDLKEDAMTVVEAHPLVEAKIGTPVRMGFSGKSTYDFSSGEESATLSKPISGPKGRGRLQAEGRKVNGEWTLTLLTVEFDGEAGTYDLLIED